MQEHVMNHVSVSNIASFIQIIWIEWRLTPILTLLVVEIRRSTDAYTISKSFRTPPNVSTVAVYANCHVLHKTNCHTSSFSFSVSCSNLLISNPLKPTMELKQVSMFALKSLNLRSAFACSVKPQILAPRSAPNLKRNTPSCKGVKIFTRTMLKLTKLALALGRTRLLENNTQRRKLGIPCSVDIYRIWIIVLRSNRLMQLLYFSKIFAT